MVIQKKLEELSEEIVVMRDNAASEHMNSINVSLKKNERI